MDNFQRNSLGSHLIFQNEANFSHRKAYLPMKISYNFGEASQFGFPLRALTSIISLCWAAYRMLNKNTQLHPVDTNIVNTREILRNCKHLSHILLHLGTYIVISIRGSGFFGWGLLKCRVSKLVRFSISNLSKYTFLVPTLN